MNLEDKSEELRKWLSDYPHVRARLVLFYAKQCALSFRKLSPNVVREVCSYLWFESKVLLTHSEAVWSFSPVTWRWRQECALPRGQQQERVIASLYYADDEAFIQTSPYSQPVCYILKNGALTVIPSLDRLCFGAIYDAPRKRLCFFGGMLENELTKECDQWLPETEEWWELPDMRRARAFFTPCWFRNKIYLCHNDVEIFDPRIDAFFFIPYLSFGLGAGQPNRSIAVCSHDEIIIINWRAIVSWNPDKNTVRKICSRSSGFAMRASPIVSQDWVYLLSDDSETQRCLALNIHEARKKALRLLSSNECVVDVACALW